jgi:NADP-dependent 3-hydroxy acid dehydrogenase YdfG
MISQLADKWVVITGASSGFGAAAVRAFGAEGAKVLLGARRLDRCKEVAAEAVKAGATLAEAHAIDVSQTNSVEEFAKWVRGKTGKVDVLINNAKPKMPIGNS